MKKIGNTGNHFTVNPIEVDYMMNDGAVNLPREDVADVILALYKKMPQRKGYKNPQVAFA